MYEIKDVASMLDSISDHEWERLRKEEEQIYAFQLATYKEETDSQRQKYPKRIPWFFIIVMFIVLCGLYLCF